MHTFQFTVHLYDYEYANVCWPHMMNLPSGRTMSDLKNLPACIKDLWDQKPRWGILSYIFSTTLY